MPVGLEETYNGVKIAPDVTYQNTYQFPEKNTNIVRLKEPAYKSSYRRAKNGCAPRYGGPNVSDIPRANQQHLYEMTKQSCNMLMENGSLRRPRSHTLDTRNKVKPVAHLLHIPPLTPQPWIKAKYPLAFGTVAAAPGGLQEDRWTPVSLHSPQYDHFISEPKPVLPIIVNGA